MARTTMVAADVLQGRRNLRLQELQPTEVSSVGDPVLALLAAIELQLGDIRERIVSLDGRLDRLQTSLATRSPLSPVESLERESEFVIYRWSPGGSEFDSQRGELPEPGDLVGEAGEAIVLNIGRSPLHGDDRPCVFALALQP
jgi:hypothetical protein